MDVTVTWTDVKSFLHIEPSASEYMRAISRTEATGYLGRDESQKVLEQWLGSRSPIVGSDPGDESE